MIGAPPAADRQFLTVQFRPGDRRTYTYHNDGPAVGAGAQVKVPDRFGDGFTLVMVVEAFVPAPTFATKAILGLADEPPVPPSDLLSGEVGT